MAYQGKFEGTAARKLHVVNPTPVKRNSNLKRQKLTNKRKRLLIAAAKALGKRILLAIGLLLAYVCVYGMMFGIMLIAIRPENPWGFVIGGVSIGYSFLVCNCRAFEYIGDKMGPKW